MNAKLITITYAGYKCDGKACKQNPQYHTKILSVNFLKLGSTVLYIEANEFGEFYCEDCIDDLYKELMPLLNKKLWAFT